MYDMFNAISALIAVVSALGGVALTHYFYGKRWERERREAYRAELFKLKLEVYGKLVGMYFEFASKTFDSALNDRLGEGFREAFREMKYFIQCNRLLLSDRVYHLVEKDIFDEIKKAKTEMDIGGIAFRQYDALAKACRAELGVEAVSNDILTMFKERPTGRIKAWVSRVIGKKNEVADSAKEK